MRPPLRGYFGFGVVGFVVVLEQQAPQQFPHAHAMARTSTLSASTLRRVRLAPSYHLSMRLLVLPHGGEPISCDPGGCCLWTARNSVTAARQRLYEASRGRLPASVRIANLCGSARCVNLDHLRLVAANASPLAAVAQCHRGHELTPDNVVRHRDGRVAYCRLCRNERRRERYRTDQDYARNEVERQRVMRQRTR